MVNYVARKKIKNKDSTHFLVKNLPIISLASTMVGSFCFVMILMLYLIFIGHRELLLKSLSSMNIVTLGIISSGIITIFLALVQSPITTTIIRDKITKGRNRELDIFFDTTILILFMVLPGKPKNISSILYSPIISDYLVTLMISIILSTIAFVFRENAKQSDYYKDLVFKPFMVLISLIIAYLTISITYIVNPNTNTWLLSLNLTLFFLLIMIINIIIYKSITHKKVNFRKEVSFYAIGAITILMMSSIINSRSFTAISQRLMVAFGVVNTDIEKFIIPTNKWPSSSFPQKEWDTVTRGDYIEIKGFTLFTTGSVSLICPPSVLVQYNSAIADIDNIPSKKHESFLTSAKICHLINDTDLRK